MATHPHSQKKRRILKGSWAPAWSEPGGRRSPAANPLSARAGDVKGESIGKTPLDLYLEQIYIQSPVFQQRSDNFRSDFQSTAM